MYKPTQTIFIILALAILLSGCLPAAETQPAPVANTPAAIIDVQSQINTSVAQTLESQNQIATYVAQTMEAQATPLPTATAIPTFTPFILTTATNTPWADTSSSYSGGGSYSGGSSSSTTTEQYSCQLVSQKPYDGDRIWHPGDSFDVTWTLENNGKRAIPAAAYFTYIGGTFMSSVNTLTLTADIQPNEKFSFRLDVFVPDVDTKADETKQLTMQWALIYKGVKLCKPYIAILVQKK